MQIKEKLLNIQKKIKVLKNQYSEFGDYHFRNVEDIQSALKPICVEERVVCVCSDELLQIGERYYVKATATLYDLDSGNSMYSSAFAREELEKKKVDGSQLTGMASSYARKYALGGLLQLDDNKDSDGLNEDLNTEKQNTNKKKEEAKRISFTLNEKSYILGDCNMEQLKWLQDNAIDDKLKEAVALLIGEGNGERQDS